MLRDEWHGVLALFVVAVVFFSFSWVLRRLLRPPLPPRHDEAGPSPRDDRASPEAASSTQSPCSRQQRRGVRDEAETVQNTFERARRSRDLTVAGAHTEADELVRQQDDPAAPDALVARSHSAPLPLRTSSGGETAMRQTAQLLSHRVQLRKASGSVFETPTMSHNPSSPLRPSSSRSKNLATAASSPFSRSFPYYSAVGAAAAPRPKSSSSRPRRNDGLSSGTRFYEHVLNRVYEQHQRLLKNGESKPAPATAGAAASRSMECGPGSQPSRDSNPRQSRQLNSSTASRTPASRSPQRQGRQPGTSGAPLQSSVVKPFQGSTIHMSDTPKDSTDMDCMQVVQHVGNVQDVGKATHLPRHVFHSLTVVPSL